VFKSLRGITYSQPKKLPDLSSPSLHVGQRTPNSFITLQTPKQFVRHNNFSSSVYSNGCILTDGTGSLFGLNSNSQNSREDYGLDIFTAIG
jgi:hypothetical protein